jgi:hypothetical protein
MAVLPVAGSSKRLFGVEENSEKPKFCFFGPDDAAILVLNIFDELPS